MNGFGSMTSYRSRSDRRMALRVDRSAGALRQCHLLTTVMDEPVPGSDVRKRYLVLYDGVPGGTAGRASRLRPSSYHFGNIHPHAT